MMSKLPQSPFLSARTLFTVRRQQLLGRTELWTLLLIMLVPRQGQHVPGEHKKHVNSKVSVVEQADGRRLSYLERERVSARTAGVGEHLGEIAAQQVGHEDEERVRKRESKSSLVAGDSAYSNFVLKKRILSYAFHLKFFSLL